MTGYKEKWKAEGYKEGQIDLYCELYSDASISSFDYVHGLSNLLDNMIEVENYIDFSHCNELALETFYDCLLNETLECEDNYLEYSKILNRLSEEIEKRLNDKESNELLVDRLNWFNRLEIMKKEILRLTDRIKYGI